MDNKLKIENPFKYSIGTRVRENIFLDMLEPVTGNKILDIGCGLGYFTDLLSGHGAITTGVDIDKSCIDYCQQNMRGKYAELDLTKIPYPYPDKSFDKILCSEVLEHVKENGTILSEAKRMLKPDGMLVATTPCPEGIFGSSFKEIGHNHVDSNSHEYHHHKGYTKESLSQLLVTYGVMPTETQYTMVAGVEAFMGLTKVFIRRTQLKKIDSQANALRMDGQVWKIYKRLFPLLLLEAKIEQPLSRILKGHRVIARAQVVK